MLRQYEDEVKTYLEKATQSLTTSLNVALALDRRQRLWRDVDRYLRQAQLSLSYLEMEVPSLPQSDRVLFENRILQYRAGLQALQKQLLMLPGMNAHQVDDEDADVSNGDGTDDDEPLLQESDPDSLVRSMKMLSGILERGQDSMMDLDGAHKSVKRADDRTLDITGRLEQSESRWGSVRSVLNRILCVVILVLVVAIIFAVIWLFLIKPMIWKESS